MKMRALLWKDIRILADVFWAGIALLVGSYFLALLLVYADRSSGFAWSKVIAGGASLTRLSAMLICALIGAYAFAREGEDRSRLFLATLPARSRDIVLSKGLIAITFFLAIWLTGLSIMAFGLHAMGYDWRVLLRVLEGMLGYIASSVMAFGAAWLLSLFMGSAIGAAFIGLMALLPVFAAQFAINWYFDLENPMFFHPAVTLFMLAAGITCIGTGSAIFIRSGGAPEEVRCRLSLPWRRGSQQHTVETAWTVAPDRVRKVGQFRTLLWKDIQLLRSSLSIGFAVFALPYAVGIAGQGQPGYFRVVSVVSIGLSILVFSFWSGQIASAEVVSGTADFLATLPASRFKITMSRMLVPLTPMVAVTVLNLLVLIGANNSMPGEIKLGGDFTWAAWPNAPFLVMGFGLANGAVLGFAVAWFVSAFHKRPAAAIVLGVMAAFVGLALWAALSTVSMELAQGPTPLQFMLLYSLSSTVIAAVLLAAGCTVTGR